MGTNHIEELSAIFAFIHKHHGREGLELALNHIHTERANVASYEFFLPMVEELQAVGLTDAATDLDHVAVETLPHCWELPCRIPPDCKALIGDWNADMAHMKTAWEAKNSLHKG